MRPAREHRPHEPGDERQGEPPAERPVAADLILRLQRSAGNAAVQRALLQRNGPTVTEQAPAPGTAYGAVEGKETLVEDGDASASPKKNFKYRFEVSFTPSAAAKAEEIAFIQTARIVSTKTGANESPYGEKRMTADHTKIDRLSGREQGWYGMTDAEAGGTTLKLWKTGGADPAWMRDTPSAAKGDRDYTFETAVVCRKGPDTGKVYAVIIWGFTVDDKLKVTPKKHEVFNTPTAGFGEAVENWNEQAAGPEADRNAPGQKPLPALK